MKKYIITLIIIFIFLNILSVCFAIKNDTDLSRLETTKTGMEGITSANNDFSTWGLLVKTFLALGVIIILIYGISKFIWRGKGFYGAKGGVIKQHYVYPLGTNKFLMLVEVGEKMLLLGVTENTINSLTEITEIDTINNIKLELSQKGSEKKFEKIFSKEVDNKEVSSRKVDKTLADKLRSLNNK